MSKQLTLWQCSQVTQLTEAIPVACQDSGGSEDEEFEDNLLNSGKLD